jgi:hypothetical protein
MKRCPAVDAPMQGGLGIWGMPLASLSRFALGERSFAGPPAPPPRKVAENIVK